MDNHYNSTLDAIFGIILLVCFIVGFTGNAISLSYFIKKKGNEAPGEIPKC